MSYLIEGLDLAGLDAEDFHRQLVASYDEAVAGIGSPIAALIVDRRAETWDGLRDRVEAWVRGHGHEDTGWAEGGIEPGSATLHFHKRDE